MKKRVGAVLIAAAAAFALSLPVQAAPIVEHVPSPQVSVITQRARSFSELGSRLAPLSRQEAGRVHKKLHGPATAENLAPVQWVTSQAYA